MLISLAVGALTGGAIFPVPTAASTQAGVATVPSALPAGRNPTEEPFSIRRHAGADWLVRPDGTRFFSLGVCCVDQGTAREKYDPEKPGYAAWRYYGRSNEWAEGTLERLTSANTTRVP